MSKTPNLTISTRILAEEAEKRGHGVERLDYFTVKMTIDGTTFYVRGSRSSFQSSIGKSFADNKFLSKKVLERIDIPTAPYQAFFSQEELEAATFDQFPVVVKPSDGNHGDNVFVGVTNRDNILKKATLIPFNEEAPLLVEQLLVGDEYRVLCVDYTFTAAVLRKPAYVTGDGTHTIEELVEIKNQDPRRADGHFAPMSLIKINDVTREILAEQNIELDYIPSDGEEVTLKKTSNVSQGGEAFNVTEQVCDENKKIFEKMAREFDLNIIGIDVMCHDLSKPLTEQEKAGIIEVNTSPGLRLHQFPGHGDPIDVGSIILDMIERYVRS